jgi:hypothetical protein
MNEPTICEECDNCIRNVDGGKANLPAYRWLCMARPRDDIGNFVSRSLRINDPYYRCRDVNDGDCRLFTQIRTPAHE